MYCVVLGNFCVTSYFVQAGPTRFLLLATFPWHSFKSQDETDRLWAHNYRHNRGVLPVAWIRGNLSDSKTLRQNDEQRKTCLAGNKQELLRRLIQMNTQMGTCISGILCLLSAKLMYSW